MFEISNTTESSNKKTVRYEPIDRRNIKRRSVEGDRRHETRDEQEDSERRNTNDRRKK